MNQRRTDFPEDEIHKIDAVEASHWWYRGMREICFPLLEAFLPERRPLRVLDIGCGTGGNLLQLQKYGDARGIDPSPLGVQYCRRKGLNVTQGSMADLGGLAGPFDLVTIFDVLTQAPASEAVPTLERIHRVLAPDGLLVFREPAMPIAAGAHDRAVGVRHRFTRRSARVALVAAGFEPLRMTYLNTLLFPLIVVFRRLEDLSSGGERAKSDVEPTSPLLNALLRRILLLERMPLRWMNLPFGVSLFVAARTRVR